MTRKASKSSLAPEDGTSPPSRSSRNQSLYDKLPVFSHIRNRTEGNISAKYLAEHTARMSAWRQGEVHLLVKEQESAVKAVRLERLVGSIGRPRHKKDKKIRDDASSKLSGAVSDRSKAEEEDNDEDEEEIGFTETEKRRIMLLTETPRPWLSPFYNK